MYFKNGVNTIPKPNIIHPIIRYATLYKCISDLIFSLSLFAMGLYRLNVIALPTPNSAKDNNDNTFVNNPFNPKYSTPNECTKLFALQTPKRYNYIVNQTKY